MVTISAKNLNVNRAPHDYKPRLKMDLALLVTAYIRMWLIIEHTKPYGLKVDWSILAAAYIEVRLIIMKVRYV